MGLSDGAFVSGRSSERAWSKLDETVAKARVHGTVHVREQLVPLRITKDPAALSITLPLEPPLCAARISVS